MSFSKEHQDKTGGSWISSGSNQRRSMCKLYFDLAPVSTAVQVRFLRLGCRLLEPKPVSNRKIAGKKRKISAKKWNFEGAGRRAAP